LMTNFNLARPWRWWGNCEDKTRYSLIKSAIQKWKSHPLEWLGVTRSLSPKYRFLSLSFNALCIYVCCCSTCGTVTCRAIYFNPPADQALKDRGGLEFAGWNAAPVDSPHESAS
jgi:hypothetical protein